MDVPSKSLLLEIPKAIEVFWVADSNGKGPATVLSVDNRDQFEVALMEGKIWTAFLRTRLVCLLNNQTTL